MSGHVYHAKIEIYTHFFAVVPKSVQMRNVIYKFAYDYVETEWKYDQATGRNVRVVGKVWGGALNDMSQFRHPISLLDKFLKQVEYAGIAKSDIEFEIAPLYIPAAADFTLKPSYVPRDYQEDGISFCFQQIQDKLYSALLQMPTGTGKTLTLLAFAARLKLRMGMVVAPAHMDKWIADGIM